MSMSKSKRLQLENDIALWKTALNAPDPVSAKNILSNPLLCFAYKAGNPYDCFMCPIQETTGMNDCAGTQKATALFRLECWKKEYQYGITGDAPHKIAWKESGEHFVEFMKNIVQSLSEPDQERLG